MTDPSPERIATLPKWAREHIFKIKNDLGAATSVALETPTNYHDACVAAAGDTPDWPDPAPTRNPAPRRSVTIAQGLLTRALAADNDGEFRSLVTAARDHLEL